MKCGFCAVGMLPLLLPPQGCGRKGDRGIITGTVKDASGAAMPRAQVTAIHLATNTNYKTSTTASGDFTVPALPVGDYRVRVENTGFKTARRKQRCGGGRSDGAAGRGDGSGRHPADHRSYRPTPRC